MGNGRYIPLSALVIFILVSGAILIGCSPDNHKPDISKIIIDREVVLAAESCEIECVAWDSEGEALSYQWSADGGSIDGNGQVVQWTAPDEEGFYHILVEVSDGATEPVIENLTVKVHKNHPPEIENVDIDAAQIKTGSQVNLTCIAQDIDDDELGYEWTFTCGYMAGEGASIIWLAPDTECECIVTATVMDPFGELAEKSVTLVVEPNNPPVIESLTAIPATVLQAETSVITCVATDPDDDMISYIWEAEGGNFTSEGSSVTWVAPTSCTYYTITVTVDDGFGGTATESFDIRVRKPG